LFCLAVSDVFIINIWCNELGRYSGSQYGLLRSIFKSSLKIFNNPKKIIFFVIKDTNEN
jgi:hypothetical protein